MQEITYIGEHRLPGLAGNFFVVLSFVAALFATVSFWYSTRKNGDPDLFRKWGRRGFYIHALSVLGIIGTLFYILVNHLYEYKYAWDHLNNAMPMRYILSCFWEGQEGSFLLWTIWHAVLGLLLIRWSAKWEPWVMTLVGLVQFFLASMLLGVFIGDYQLGSNPFLLMREHPANAGLPWTMNPDYMSMKPFQDGKGLNPLLQNYWMTIHPPILFLGFASTLIPFVYAVAGLWKGDRTGWIKPAIPWAFFGVMILGTGILMGGAWAYEALGFGGFWAWDPVENASLVPWLTLVGAAHLLVINQRNQTALFSAFMLNIGSFLLVLYSTFLTRSGVLGDSSVHSFVDSGILPQLLVYLCFFVALATTLLVSDKKRRIGYVAICFVLLVLSVLNLAMLDPATIPEDAKVGQGTWVPILSIVFVACTVYMLIYAYRRSVPKPEKEEELWSREFWLFIGALVLTISAIHITWETSKSVLNIFLQPFSSFFLSMHESTGWGFLKTLGEHNLTSAKESERFHQFHRIQVPLAFILFLLISCGQYFRYRSTDMTLFVKKIILSAGLALAVILVLCWTTSLGQTEFPILALIFSCLFAILSNADYAWRTLRGQFDILGASVAHIGFALLILGAVISTSQQYAISHNERGDISKLGEGLQNNQDLLLFEGDTLSMGKYFVRFGGTEKRGIRFVCSVDYFQKEPKVYHLGDRVTFRGMVLYCTQEHTASPEILTDVQDSVWSQELNGEKYLSTTKPWQNGVPGEFLFTLEPSILTSPKGNSREPSIHHDLHQDVYTYLKHAQTDEPAVDEDGYLEPHVHNLKVGDQVLVSNTVVSLETIAPVVTPEEKAKFRLLDKDIAARCVVHIERSGVDTIAEPLFIIRDSLIVPDEYVSTSFGLKFLVQSINPSDATVSLVVWEKKDVAKDFIVMTATVFPFINVLWIGCLVMVIGTTMAIRHRIRISRQKKKEISIQ